MKGKGFHLLAIKEKVIKMKEEKTEDQSKGKEMIDRLLFSFLILLFLSFTG